MILGITCIKVIVEMLNVEDAWDDSRESEEKKANGIALNHAHLKGCGEDG